MTGSFDLFGTNFTFQGSVPAHVTVEEFNLTDYHNLLTIRHFDPELDGFTLECIRRSTLSTVAMWPLRTYRETSS